MKKTLVMLSLAAMCSATSVFAADKMMMDKDQMGMMVDKHMKMMDTNGDGMLSKDEYMAGMGKMFDDNSHKGMMSKDDMMKMKMSQMKDMGMMKKDGMMMGK